MDMTSITKFFTDHYALTIILAFFLIGFSSSAISYLREKLDFYIWYFVAILIVLLWAVRTDNAETNHLLYFFAFMLGMLTAFAEIIGKFSDEPIKSLRTPHALFYHLLNGAISAFALFALKTYGQLPTNNQEKLQLVLVAGLGSMLVMRSKLFNLKVGGEDVALGPEQIINVFFRFMESEIDRLRAQSRIDFVRARLKNIDFDKVQEYSLTMLRAAQALDTQEKCRKEMQALVAEQFADRQMKSYALGFLLLNRMGENFVTKLFDGVPKEWVLAAPIAEEKEVKDTAGLLGRLAALRNSGAKDNQKETNEVYYMAYGTSMSSRLFRARLGWEMEETEFANKTEPKVCVLRGHQLAFDKPDNPDEVDPALVRGMPNVAEVADGAGEVEGVLYKLTNDQIEFLDRTEHGYKRKPVEVVVDGQPTKAAVYRAEIVRPELKPAGRVLQQMLDGAREHHLSAAYVAGLEAIKATAVEDSEPLVPPAVVVTSQGSEAGGNGVQPPIF